MHSLGLKFGLYSDGWDVFTDQIVSFLTTARGYYACDFVGGTAHYLGSLEHEEDDAQSFASWGADYLKYDNCYAVSETDFVDFDPPIVVSSLACGGGKFSILNRANRSRLGRQAEGDFRLKLITL